MLLGVCREGKDGKLVSKVWSKPTKQPTKQPTIPPSQSNTSTIRRFLIQLEPKTFGSTHATRVHTSECTCVARNSDAKTPSATTEAAVAGSGSALKAPIGNRRGVVSFPLHLSSWSLGQPLLHKVPAAVPNAFADLLRARMPLHLPRRRRQQLRRPPL